MADQEGREEREDEMSKKNEGYRGGDKGGRGHQLVRTTKTLEGGTSGREPAESEGAAADESRELGARKLEKSI